MVLLNVEHVTKTAETRTRNAAATCSRTWMKLFVTSPLTSCRGIFNALKGCNRWREARLAHCGGESALDEVFGKKEINHFRTLFWFVLLCGPMPPLQNTISCSFLAALLLSQTLQTSALAYIIYSQDFLFPNSY